MSLLGRKTYSLSIIVVFNLSITYVIECLDFDTKPIEIK